MSALPNWLNTDLFSALRDKYNALNGFFNGLTGGTTGQKLVKASGTDFAFDWVDPGAEIPNQFGNAGKSLTTDGTNPSWAYTEVITDGTNLIKHIILPIGSWNMDTAGTKTVSHGLPDITKILPISVVIMNDGGSLLTSIVAVDSGAGSTIDGSWAINSTSIVLSRSPSGSYDGANYNDSTINRGWITIPYLA